MATPIPAVFYEVIGVFPAWLSQDDYLWSSSSYVPASDWSVAAMATPAAVSALAQRLLIALCIAAVRVRHDTGIHTLFPQFRDKVKAALGIN